MWWQVIAGAAAAATVAVVIPLGLDLYMPVPEINPLTVQKIALGRQLFFDPRLSRDQSISCSSCHRPDRAFSDSRAVAVGVLGRAGRRNAPALVNRGYGRLFFWDGRSSSLEEQVVKPISDPNEMDLPIEDAARRVGLEAQDISRALASYVRSILSGNSASTGSSTGTAALCPRRSNSASGCSAGRGTAPPVTSVPTSLMSAPTIPVWRGRRAGWQTRAPATARSRRRPCARSLILRRTCMTAA